MIWTDIESLVDMGLSDLLSDILDCPLIVSLIGDVSTSLGDQKWNNQQFSQQEEWNYFQKRELQTGETSEL